jgi:small ligand-binding sensory domain FIST
VAVKIATGLAENDAGVDSFAEAAARAALGLGGAPAHLAIVFAAASNLDHAEEGIAAVQDRLDAATLVGCGAQGVVAADRELEHGGVAVWAASLPDAHVEGFHLDTMPLGEGQLAVSGMPDLDGADAMLLMPEPYTFPVEPLLAQIAEDHPGLPVIGGLSSAGGGPGAGVLMHDEHVERAGAVGVALTGVDVRPCVSQGARPIGPEMAITSCDANVIQELSSRPALERLQEAIAELDLRERALAAQGLLMGIVIDPNKPDYERGDFLIRGLVDADPEDGSITVGELVRVGQTVRMQVRDAESADQDLRDVLARRLGDFDGPPAGVLLFTCNGRGRQMFAVPDHDASALAEASGGAPAAGFFCAGEIGPVGDRNFVHGFTATLAVFGSN